jgi:DNA-binding transcriptional regulator YiaG
MKVDPRERLHLEKACLALGERRTGLRRLLRETDKHVLEMLPTSDRLGLSRGHFADMVGVSRQTIYRWEKEHS